MSDHDDISRGEAQISADLRDSAELLMKRTKRLLQITDGAMERLCEQLPDALAPDGGILSEDRADEVLGILDKLSRIVKTNAEAAEKVIRVERQVRGDPTEAITIAGLQTPETTEQVRDALKEELEALSRHQARSTQTK